jgi:uncharacterized lipoprotein YmbA
MIRAAALAVLVLLAACSSAPTRYYTLLAPETANAVPAADPAFQFSVAPVAIPPQVDVPQLVVRQGAGSMLPVETRRWVAPLASELRDALAANLHARLAVPDVSGVNPDPRLPLFRVRVAVQRFESQLAKAARIDAAWTIESARDAKLAATCESSVTVPVAEGYEALAEGHQKAVANIAVQIAAALLQLRVGNASGACAASTP